MEVKVCVLCVKIQQDLHELSRASIQVPVCKDELLLFGHTERNSKLLETLLGEHLDLRNDICLGHTTKHPSRHFRVQI